MRFRPRYSLLTLLIVTALVAGGVKLWYGPHHVVKLVSPEEEDEYTYTRDWRGNKVIDGPRIQRTLSTAESRLHFEVTYYRAGVQTSWRRGVQSNSESKQYYYFWGLENWDRIDLTPQEEAERDRIVEQEIQRLQAEGYTYEQFKNERTLKY